MPGTSIWSVCITCRDIHPKYTLLTDDEDNILDRICKKCGGSVSRAPYKWSPPKKTNDRAWKRIAKGEWLWDRRRVRRVAGRFGYQRVWRSERRPTHKPGQETAVVRSWPEPGRELGG